MKRITINGITGDESPELRDRQAKELLRELADDAAANGGEVNHASASEKLHAFHDVRAVAVYHNGMVDVVNTDLVAAQNAYSALAAVESTWLDLASAEQWHAAHHRFVRAVFETRDALASWKATRTAVMARHHELLSGGSGVREMTCKNYDKYVPDAERFSMPDTTEPDAREQEFERIAARRLLIAGHTAGTRTVAPAPASTEVPGESRPEWLADWTQ